MALVYHLGGVVRAGRLDATFLLHDIEHDKSFIVDSSFDADLPEGPWEFVIMAAASELLCVRGRNPTQGDVLMLCSPEQQAWKRLPLCNTVKRVKRVGMCFQKDDHSYKVLATEFDGETMVTEVFDSKLGTWSTGVQQEKQFHKLLGRCEFDHETQEFFHLVVKEEHRDRDEKKVYSMIRYKEASGWHIVDMNLPARMSDYHCEDDHHGGYADRFTNRWVKKASLVGNGNGLKLLVETRTTSANHITSDFLQTDSLIYEYDTAAGKWQTMFLCSSTDAHYSWKQKVNKRKYRWFKEGSRWYPAVIGTSGKKNAVRIDCIPGSESESDIGSGEHVVPPIVVPAYSFRELCPYNKRLPRRKLPRGRGDPRMKPSEEACALMLKSLNERLCKRFGHGNKVFMVSEGETDRIVMYDCIRQGFSVLHLSEPCVLRKDKDLISGFANWDPVCVDLGVNDSNVWKQHGFSVQENQLHEKVGVNKLMGGNGLLVYDMTSRVSGNGSLVVSLMVHDVVEDKGGVINLVYDAGLQDAMWEIELVSAAGCFLCFRCKHALHKDVYLICKPASNSWQTLPPPTVMGSKSRPWNVVGMYVDDAHQASYKVLVMTGEETAMFDSEAWSWTGNGKGEWTKGCTFDNASGGFLTLNGSCIATYAARSKEWKTTGIQLPRYREQQLFGSNDRSLLMVHRTGRCVVYGVNTKQSRLEPMLLNRQFVGDVKDLTGAIILEELEESEAQELVLGATECFGRGDRIFWAKREDERVVMYDCVGKQFKVLHIGKPWGKYDDGHRRPLRKLPYMGYMEVMNSCYTHSVYLCTP